MVGGEGGGGAEAGEGVEQWRVDKGCGGVGVEEQESKQINTARPSFGIPSSLDPVRSLRFLDFHISHNRVPSPKILSQFIQACLGHL